jgi:thiamine-phosphate diphosphorylase
VIRYLITDGSASADVSRWLAHLAGWMERGVDFIQIRERNLEARALSDVTRRVLALPNPRGTKILVNDRADIAIACGAHGVHLRDGSVGPELFAKENFLVTMACHRLEELKDIRGADYILLSPVFRGHGENAEALGLDAFRRAVKLSTCPVLALGGITSANEDTCVAAGAAGIAGISYFADAGA